MIVTLTANPSLDRTIELGGPLQRGAVQRATAAHRQPGGKGVNIARALAAAEIPCLALLTGAADDPVLIALTAEGIEHLNLAIPEPLRSNVTVTEPDGTTTKVNEPGPELSAQQQAALIRLCVEHSAGRRWLVLAGSLPCGVAEDFYARAIHTVREKLGAAAPLIAVDSSGQPLHQALAARPDLIKPNAEELAELVVAAGLASTGSLPAPELLETQPDAVAKLAEPLVRSGVGNVLATLGAHGAVLIEKTGSWHARGPKIVARSTVGAGDAALSGYLLAQLAGASAADRLRQAVAHGAAAAALPGSTMPKPEHTRVDGIEAHRLSRPPKEPNHEPTHHG